ELGGAIVRRRLRHGDEVRHREREIGVVRHAPAKAAARPREAGDILLNRESAREYLPYLGLALFIDLQGLAVERSAGGERQAEAELCLIGRLDRRALEIARVLERGGHQVRCTVLEVFLALELSRCKPARNLAGAIARDIPTHGARSLLNRRGRRDLSNPCSFCRGIESSRWRAPLFAPRYSCARCEPLLARLAPWCRHWRARWSTAPRRSHR